MNKLRGENKFSDFIFENRFSVLAFCCSAFIMFIVFMCFNLFPFGDITILRMDLYHQYGPLFSELYDRVTSGGSLAYSWNTGMGGNFLGNYFNYLSSPIGFIVMLIAGHKNMPEAIAVMVLIKAALSALTFSVYLKLSQHKSNYITTGFSVLYSFCGWFIAYYWNIMWIDAVILLPLVALGIERIINNGKPAIYIAALSLTMFSNYYMSFMMCVFAVLYFLTYYISNYSVISKLPNNFDNSKNKFKNSRFLRSGFKFALASACSAGLIAFALVPTFFALQACSATSRIPPSSSSLYFSIFDFLANHLASVNPTIRSSGDDVLPNVYCGIITLILVPLYLFTKSISKKEKLAYTSLLAIFFIGFNLNYLNYFWHGLHFPNDLPYRQSFMYSFILLIIAFKTFTRLREISNKIILVSALAVVALTVFAEELKSKNVTTVSIIISLVFAVIYSLVLVTLKDKRFQNLSVSVLLLCCICSEAIIADTGNYSMDQPKENYAGDYEDFREIKDYIDSINTDAFYRMELTHLRARMDPSWYNYNGVSTFSSMAYQSVSVLQKKMGMHGNTINSYTYNPQTAVYNSMMGLKYLINNTDTDVLADTSMMDYLYSVNKFSAYENQFTLPIAYCVNNEITDWERTSINPFEVQSDLFYKATGLEDVFETVYPNDVAYGNINTFAGTLEKNDFAYSKVSSNQDADVTFYFEAKSNSEHYIFVTTTNSNDETMTVNTDDLCVTQTLQKSYPYILNIGELKKGEIFTVKVPVDQANGTVNVYAVSLNDKIFKDGYEKMKKTQITYTKFSDTYISGTFTADRACTLMTSIPYDTGWSVYLDGEKILKGDKFKIGDAYLGLYVTSGEHEIILKYSPTGLNVGVLISFVTILILGLFMIVQTLKKRKGNYNTRFDKVNNSFDSEIFIRDIQEENKKLFDDIFANSDLSLPVREIITPFDIFTDDEIISTDSTENEFDEPKEKTDEEIFNEFFTDLDSDD